MSRMSGSPVELIVGGGFALMGLLFMVVFGQRSTLECQRLESTLVTCQVQRDFLGVPVSNSELRQVRRAAVAVSSDEEGDTYRVQLVNDETVLPLTVYFSSGSRGKYDQAGQINAFLSDPARVDYRTEEMNWFALLLSAFFAVAGLGMLGDALVAFGRRRWRARPG